MHEYSHPYAGGTVIVRDTAEQFWLEDWWDKIGGQSWQYSAMAGNWAAKNYRDKVESVVSRIPADDEVVYGKIGSLGYIFHVSELIDANGNSLG